MTSPPASPQDDNELLQLLGMPEWIEQFVEKEFFHKCSTHRCKRNEVNRYCTTCNASACLHCIENGDHNEHQLLTIYRHVYQEVVPLNQTEEHMNCSKIQIYRCNKKWVISLKPLPHKGSGSHIEGKGVCIICKRKLTNPNDDRFFFCSIACKLHTVLRRIHVIKTRRAMLAMRAAKPTVDQRAASALSRAAASQLARPAADQQAASTSQTGRKHSRKGVPDRASTKV